MSMIPIASVTIPAGTSASVAFNNIPQTFTHLHLRCFVRNNLIANGPNMPIQFNGDTGSNYNGFYLAGDSTGSPMGANFPGAGSAGNFGWTGGSNTTAHVYGASLVDILDYTNTNKYKVFRSLNGINSNEGGTGNNLVGLWSGVWLSNNAITSISFSSGYQYYQYSRFDLYGISASTVTGA